MKLLFVLLVVAAAAMADPEAVRERRGLLGAPLLGAPLLAPRTAIITPGLALGHGPALIAPAPVLAPLPLAKAVIAPGIWG